MRTYYLCGVLAAIALQGTAAFAQDKGEPAAPPPAFQAVLDCEKVAAPQERLACFDKAVSAMSTAVRDRQLAVFDRTTMREARRGIFGLGLPKLKLFGGDQSEEVTAIDSTIAAVRMAGDGMPIFVLEDGARWKQTEGRNVYPKSGQPIHIKRAAMGSYMANINKQPGVRVVRIAN